jgi:mannosyltransferase OCH1-like enzyme
MIPKKIHYCWFGGNPLPPLAVKCIESWKKFLPDYEIKEWHESNFDVNIIPYTQEAYQAGKYAFVSDYARFWILYKYGGLYFDTDVEVIKPMDDIIARGPFMGCENEASDTSVASVAPGLGLGVNPGLGLYKEILEKYSTLHFIRKDRSFNLKTVVQYTTELLCEHGLKETKEIQFCAGVWIYPKDYLSPKDFETGVMEITVNTVAIHHYDGSWVSDVDRYAQQLKRSLTWIPFKGLRGHLAFFYSYTHYHGWLMTFRLFVNKIKYYLCK